MPYAIGISSGGSGSAGAASVSASLSGLQWLLPVLTNVNPTTYTCSLSPIVVSALLTGSGGKAYNVSLRFRGEIECNAYTGGSNDGAFWQVGGTPEAGGPNIYSLTISSPAQTYYVNRGSSAIFKTYALDFNKTIVINAGATVTLTADSVNGFAVRNQDGTGSNPISVSGISSPAQPYAGQFVQMDVVSIT